MWMHSKTLNCAHLIDLVQSLMPKIKMQDESKKHRKQSALTTKPSESKTSASDDDDDTIHLPTGTLWIETSKQCRRKLIWRYFNMLTDKLSVNDDNGFFILKLD